MQHDIFSGLYSLVAFQVNDGAQPYVLVANQKIDWGTWGANGKIYYWDRVTSERYRLDPPAEWSTSNAGPFPDRSLIVFLHDDRPGMGFRAEWFRTSPEEQGAFDYHNPGQTSDLQLVSDAFSHRQRFLAYVPQYCGTSAVVDEHGKIVTHLWSVGCRDLSLEFVAVASNGQFLLGLGNEEANGWSASFNLYLGDAGGTWRVPIEGAPQGTAPAASRVGYSVAYETVTGDSICVGNLEIH